MIGNNIGAAVQDFNIYKNIHYSQTPAKQVLIILRKSISAR